MSVWIKKKCFPFKTGSKFVAKHILLVTFSFWRACKNKTSHESGDPGSMLWWYRSLSLWFILKYFLMWFSLYLCSGMCRSYQFRQFVLVNGLTAYPGTMRWLSFNEFSVSYCHGPEGKQPLPPLMYYSHWFHVLFQSKNIWAMRISSWYLLIWSSPQNNKTQ
jgi:hypothetical protein